MSVAATAPEIVATGIDRDEAIRRLESRFARWPAFGLRLSLTHGFAADVGADGFRVRELPRLAGSTMFEAIGRWRPEGGAEVRVAPVALDHMPLVIVNAMALVVIFGAVLMLGARSAIQLWIQLFGVGALALFSIAVIAQLVPMMWLEWRHGAREREALLALVRDVLGR